MKKFKLRPIPLSYLILIAVPCATVIGLIVWLCISISAYNELNKIVIEQAHTIEELRYEAGRYKLLYEDMYELYYAERGLYND